MADNNPNVVGKGFDRITVVYDAVVCISSFNRINKSQLAFLSHLSTQKMGLILGGGTGYFLQKVLDKNEQIHITYVDASAKMIEYARKRIKKNRPNALHRVTFICSGVEDLEWQNYDLIVCNYILDLFDNAYVQVLAEKFKKHLTTKGLLYVTDFHIAETNGFMKWGTQTGLKVLYTLFRWTTQLQTKQLPETERLLKEQRFVITQSEYFLNGILACHLYKRTD
ncbi:class I SAM-dependent methyltransferase [Flavobacterium sp. 5]|uniref:class I SAM-dependent methyltransferase n=1 Tax=Flavobacterium sp. 5 TaxID=2035199 RepID=UPI000C2C9EF5|nr:class I SAM-dependent methyltransferase [Flavobacterium sp. 5]PKB15284.1 methyltransferase family protein [Flavobacterium sp. 5]